MIYQYLIIILFVNGVVSLWCHTAKPSNCYYNSTCKYEKKECDGSKISNLRGGIYCTTVITNADDIIVGNMDCMYDQETSKICKNQTQCIMKYINKQKQFLHCCCEKDFCNLNFTLNLSQIDSILDDTTTESISACKGLACKTIYIVILCLIIGFILITIIICFIYRKKLIKSQYKICRLFGNSPTIKGDNSNPDENKSLIIHNNDNNYEINFQDLIFERRLREGRFSEVYQGIFQNRRIAIKILSNNSLNGEGKNLFENEKYIYSLPYMDNSNILKYYGFSINQNKYYLITEYSEYGSLRDVLRSRLLRDENELKLILKSISDGLEYLHRDFSKKPNSDNKTRPPIAHRDFKPENILYLNNEKLVICDFAMSIKIDQNQYIPNEQQQIGTPRYMSPEILAGTIGCEPNALLKCDVYALGIIFWEVLSRCPTIEVTESYEMPYDEQLIKHGSNNPPEVNDMLKIMNMSIPYNRPIIRSSWKDCKNNLIIEIIQTMEYCWEQNPDARINAALAARRMGTL